MKKIFQLITIALIFISAFCGCKKNHNNIAPPENLINRITLVNILAESYIIESTLHVIPNDSIGKDELARRYYKELFDRYQITNKQFEESMNYYLNDQKTAEKLLNDASALIINKRNEMPEQDAPPVPVFDMAQ